MTSWSPGWRSPCSGGASPSTPPGAPAGSARDAGVRDELSPIQDGARLMLDGKRLLITGVLTRKSIAFAVAHEAQLAGAEVVLTGSAAPGG